MFIRHFFILFGILATTITLTANSAAGEMQTFSLIIRAGHFVPNMIEVPANTKFRLIIKNEGPGAEEFESAELRKEKVLAAGASSFLIFQPLKPGRYKFFGEFHPETAQGQLIVK